MLGRIFSRTPGTYQVIMILVLTFFVVYELKQIYHKYQKEQRLAFYNAYVNEVYHFADRMEESDIKSSGQIKELTKVLQAIFKKNTSSTER